MAGGSEQVPCFTPLKAYRAHGGGVVFSSKEGFADRPLELPCGQCRGCRMERARQWAVRCMHEARCHERNCFVTLTYSDEELPADGSLDVSHWQKFAKRLRERCGPFRFFHCGEYGEETRRPHYHALIFGLDFSEDRQKWKRGKRGDWLYSSPTLESVWGHGYCPLGDVTYESAQYVAKYVMKKKTGGQADEYGGRKPPYVTMSRRPGIGSRWLERFGDEVYPGDEVRLEGRRFRPPRFYDEKLDEDELASLKRKRRDAVQKHKGELTPERLREREAFAEAVSRAQMREPR